MLVVFARTPCTSNYVMKKERETTDLLVVGAGPIGIACGVEARRSGMPALVFDKGALTNALCFYPPNLVWFSTAELLEIGDIPLVCSGAKPTGPEVIHYYRRVAEHFKLDLRLYEGVEKIEPIRGGGFRVESSRGRIVIARGVVLATGFFDQPNLLGVAGEELPKVKHYNDGPYVYYGQHVAVVGAGNSAVEVALDLYRSGAASVALIHRGTELAPGIKYWVRPDIENRIKEGSVRAFFETTVERIEEDTLTVRGANGESTSLKNDFVLAMTGYHADFDFIRRVGVNVDPETLKPELDPETMETNVPGMYCAGVIVGGRDSNKIFIENSRIHAKKIVAHALRR